MQNAKIFGEYNQTIAVDRIKKEMPVFNKYLYPGQSEGAFFTLFAIGVSAAETAIAIAIIINIYRNLKNIYVDEVNKMKF